MKPIRPALAMIMACASLLTTCASLSAATTRERYYAYPAVHDAHGVIAPWYTAPNGQFDYRVRIAAETMKRYPWTDRTRAAAAAPEYVFSGSWNITAEGQITVPPIEDWANGDLVQRAAYVLAGLVDYYRYSGDAAAIAHLSLQADALLDFGQTPDDHPWPRFLIGAPTAGKPYGQSDPRGFMQLDIVAECGLALVRAAELTGNARWLQAARHWADLLAEKRSRDAGRPPWPRYANPQDVPWEDAAGGNVVFILDFLDAILAGGYQGRDGEILRARADGVRYLREVLLPDWTGHETWGRNYWDWPCPVQVENVTEFAARYLMNHPEEFPNWRSDARNVASLFLNRTGADPQSRGDVYSGAWAYPESSGCCGTSLWYGPLELANVYAQYGVQAASPWGLEMARRQLILATYDCHETGVVEDNIEGGPIVAGAWFKIAHPMALKHVLAAMAWMPEVFGPSRENHIMRSASTVTDVSYADGLVRYATFAADAPAIDVLRLAFVPARVEADGRELSRRTEPDAIGYTVNPLPDGDCILTVRHDGARRVSISGDDPQEARAAADLQTAGTWSRSGDLLASSEAGAEISMSFEGNQVRLLGDVGPDGGLAEVWLDGTRQLVGIDCWNPAPRTGQVLYWRNGLAQGPHTLRIVVRGQGNPVSAGSTVRVRGTLHSAASPRTPPTWGAGGGPADAQRFVFGRTAREDYMDSRGQAWRPGTEFVVRVGTAVDTVAASWYTTPRRLHIDGTEDPELYRFGIHGREFWVDFTVAPGTYHARLKFCEHRNIDPSQRAMTITINGREVISGFDIAGTAAAAAGLDPQPRKTPVFTLWPGLGRAIDLVFDDIQPAHGIISIRFRGDRGAEAIVQAIEVGPGPGGPGATPVVVPATPAPARREGNLLNNGGFEDGAINDLGNLGKTVTGKGWTYVFAGVSPSYIWSESAYSIHPEWGLPEFQAGKEALRTHTDGQGHTIVYQEVEVEPDTAYEASAWVRAVDLHGKGFGTSPGDSAGLRIQELDGNAALVADHPLQAVTSPTTFTRLALPFTSGPKTARVRFILEARIGGHYTQGHVTWDECALVRQPR